MYMQWDIQHCICNPNRWRMATLVHFVGVCAGIDSFDCIDTFDWSILWAKFLMKTNEKKEKKGARIFPFPNVFVFKQLNASTNTNITFYAYNYAFLLLPNEWNMFLKCALCHYNSNLVNSRTIYHYAMWTFLLANSLVARVREEGGSFSSSPLYEFIISKRK